MEAEKQINWSRVVRNKKGEEFEIRPAASGDRDALERMFRSCSPETLYTRFLSPGLGVPLRYLDRLMFHKPPGVVSLVAVDREPPELEIVGLMNCVETGPGGHCEIAIVVGDNCQNRGLGSAMVRTLIEVARENGAKKLIADVDAGNRRVFHLIQRSGLPCRINIDQGVAHAEMDLAPPT